MVCRTLALLTCIGIALGMWTPSHGPWIRLFDGRTFTGWTNTEGGPVREGWRVEDGCIRRHKTGAMDIITTRTFLDFELELDWKLLPGSNSGVKYRLHRLPDGKLIGPEYQIMDDPTPPTPPDKGSCGALYSILEPSPAVIQKPPGQWNRLRIVALRGHIEHWLNGRRLLAIDQDSPEWNDRLAQSKFAQYDGYREWFGREASPILLQDHGGNVWFRNIRIREWR